MRPRPGNIAVVEHVDALRADHVRQAVRDHDDRAVVVISHRLANVVCAQRIYVLDHGDVAGAGTHEELLRGCGAYRALWSAQAELESLTRGAARPRCRGGRR